MAAPAGALEVIVIGSGGLGAATAYYLAQRGVAPVALVDQHAIGSQTSPRAAGMLSALRTSDLMTSLITRAAAQLKGFSTETGQPLDWVQSGSLKVARRAQDDAVLERDLARGQRCGLDVERVSPQDARRLHPFLETAGVVGVLRIGDDLYFEPSQVARGFARGAQMRGVTVLPHTRVRRVLIEHGQVTGVDTAAGVLRAPCVVDAAGAWTRQVAAASGITVPLVPTVHQLVVTAPVPGARPDLPMVRIMDAAVYLRPSAGGFLWGVFEEDPRFYAMEALGDRFDVQDLPLDAAVLERAARAVADQLPVLQQVPVREQRGGLPTMTADGQHILGPAPDVRGFFFASGCNVAGLSIAPALGDALAAWIVEGTPPVDLTPLSVERFGATSWPEDALRRQAAWQYRHFYGAV
jgi:4-methylaminobutanoate oxidase (formaldehyde-forming)